MSESYPTDQDEQCEGTIPGAYTWMRKAKCLKALTAAACIEQGRESHDRGQNVIKSAQLNISAFLAATSVDTGAFISVPACVHRWRHMYGLAPQALLVTALMIQFAQYQPVCICV